MKIRMSLILILFVGLILAPWVLSRSMDDELNSPNVIPPGRAEVVFWHFWGGRDRDVVENVVRRFNESQDEHWVRAIAMPGNNLQAKLFLSVAGGDPPDLVNQDDPVLADWAERGVIQSFNTVAEQEVEQVSNWMFDSARRLSSYDGKLFGVCNGLDIRALYYNKTSLDQFQLSVPKTLADLDKIANTISPEVSASSFAYLPDSRRLWAWGYVFGGDFYDSNSAKVLVDSPQIVEAATWMQSYSKKYGPDNIAAFRQGDQSLPGKSFPLLPIGDDSMKGRYTLVMDGQWRVRDIVEFQRKRRSSGKPYPEFGVCPLPAPAAGRTNAGWVNGNFFVLPTGSGNPQGAWEFAKFWIGFNQPADAAKTCAAGGWIPVSKSVVDAPDFQDYLEANPMFGQFVDLASSPNQFPVPLVAGASFFKRNVESAGYEAISNPDKSPSKILAAAQKRIETQLERTRLDLKQSPGSGGDTHE